MNVAQKYHLLQTIARVLRVLAWVVLVAGIVATIVVLVSAGSATDQFARSLGTAGAIVLPIMSIGWFVQLYAYGSILSLLVEIEQNTRALAEHS